MVAFYNTGMGGTDLGDQKLAYYRNAMHSAKWQVRIFVHVLHMAALNAHIFYIMIHGLSNKDKGYRFKEFLEVLILQLFQEGSDKQKPTTPTSGSKRKQSPVSVCAPVTRKRLRLDKFLCEDIDLSTDHKPFYWPKKDRPHCIMCKKRTYFSCQDCQVGICMVPADKGSTESCYNALHPRKKCE